MRAGSEDEADDEVSESDGLSCASSLVPLETSEGGSVKNSLSGLSASRLLCWTWAGLIRSNEWALE